MSPRTYAQKTPSALLAAHTRRHKSVTRNAYTGTPAPPDHSFPPPPTPQIHLGRRHRPPPPPLDVETDNHRIRPPRLPVMLHIPLTTTSRTPAPITRTAMLPLRPTTPTNPHPFRLLRHHI